MPPFDARSLIDSINMFVNKSCGTMYCPPNFLCVEHKSRCSPCEDYCVSSSDYFDMSMCEQQCQDYLQTNGNELVADNDLGSEAIGIQVAVYTLMVMIPLFVIFLISVSVYFVYRRCHSKQGGNEDEASLLKHKVRSNQDEDIDGEINESENENTEATSSNSTNVNAESNDLDVAEAGCSSESPTSKNVPTFHTVCDCENNALDMALGLDETIVADTAM